MWRANENHPFRVIFLGFSAISPLLIASFYLGNNPFDKYPCVLHCTGDGGDTTASYEIVRARIAYPYRVAAGSTDDQLFLHLYARQNQETLNSKSKDDLAVKPKILKGLAIGMPQRPAP